MNFIKKWKEITRKIIFGMAKNGCIIFIPSFPYKIIYSAV